MRHDYNYVKQCMVCQQAKDLHTSPVGLLYPILVPSHIWEDIAMEFIFGLPNSRGYTVIYVVIDHLSKYSHFMPLKSDFSSTIVA